MPGEGERIETGAGHFAIPREAHESGLSPDEVQQFKGKFSGLQVGSPEYQRALQDLHRAGRAARYRQEG